MKKETNLELILDNLPFNTWYKNKSGTYIEINKSFQEYTGIPKEAIIGKSDFDIYPMEEAEIYTASDKATILDKGQEFFESMVNGKWKEEYKRAVRDKSGKIIGTTGFSRDITKRKKIEEALKESERSKAVLLSNLPGVAYRCINDKNWTMTFLSDGCFELTGYRPEELVGNKMVPFNDLITDEFKQKTFKKWEMDIAENKKSNDEYVITTKSGETKWVWDQSIGIPDQNGMLTESEGFIMDITERKRAVAAINESEDRFKTIFDSASQTSKKS